MEDNTNLSELHLLQLLSVQINNIEQMLENQAELLSTVLDNMTLSKKQQERIHNAGLERVAFLIGENEQAKDYSELQRVYLPTLWTDFNIAFHCENSYKDLCPTDFYKALDYIDTWRYPEI